MKTQRLLQFCSKVCVGALLITALQAVAFAADDTTVDVGSVKPGTTVEVETVRDYGDYTVEHIGGQAWTNERKALTNTPSALPTDNLYDFDDIPKDWVIPIRKDGDVVGYYVVVPGNNTSLFRISGTEFATVQKMGDNGYGTAIELTEGKARTYYEHALKLMLR